MSENDDDTIGFKDFIEFTEEARKKKNNATDQMPSFELFTFLEQESERLSKRIRLFEEKTFVLKNYPQSESLILKQKDLNQSIRAKVIGKLSEQDSPLFESMREIFADHFKKN